ncbi:MAG: MBL fold metallo-hydrolase, partial [Anaerolineae bacterium]
MILRRVVDEGLSQYSYVVACPGAGEAAVIDPRRDVDTYTGIARDENLRIAHVLETHIHADFASGSRELAAITGAELHLSAYDDGEVYDVAFPHRPMGDGDRLAFGDVVIEAAHTPGHTPEHLSYLVYEISRAADTPALMLSGDFLFVGSLGRPDLLGEEAKDGLARRLYASVQTKLAGLPDGLEVHPGHGAGSMCGAGMGGRGTSTLGFERLANPYLAPQTEDAFLERILASAPPFPPYYRRMKALNAAGPPILGDLPGKQPLTPAEVGSLMTAGHVVVDLRNGLH